MASIHSLQGFNYFDNKQVQMNNPIKLVWQFRIKQKEIQVDMVVHIVNWVLDQLSHNQHCLCVEQKKRKERDIHAFHKTFMIARICTIKM